VNVKAVDHVDVHSWITSKLLWFMVMVMMNLSWTGIIDLDSSLLGRVLGWIWS